MKPHLVSVSIDNTTNNAPSVQNKNPEKTRKKIPKKQMNSLRKKK